jgi:hypothetical protein
VTAITLNECDPDHFFKRRVLAWMCESEKATRRVVGNMLKKGPAVFALRGTKGLFGRQVDIATVLLSPRGMRAFLKKGPHADNIF